MNIGTLDSQTLMEKENLSLDGLQERAETLEREGKIVMFLATGGKVAGLVAVPDTLKPGSRQAVKSLRRLGLDVVMLTGDNTSAAAIARQAGVDRFEAEVRPGEKADRVKAMQIDGKTVSMVGNGINDAPATAHADIGIAMGTGTDVATEAADMTLVGGEL